MSATPSLIQARHHATADAWRWLEDEVRNGNMPLEKAAEITIKLMDMDALLRDLDKSRNV